jgi:hypothetical protein
VTAFISGPAQANRTFPISSESEDAPLSQRLSTQAVRPVPYRHYEFPDAVFEISQ